jgi:hypothetical protein
MVRENTGTAPTATLSRYMTVAKPYGTSNPPGQLYFATKPERCGDKFCPFSALLLICLMSATTGGKVHMATDNAH